MATKANTYKAQKQGFHCSNMHAQKTGYSTVCLNEWSGRSWMSYRTIWSIVPPLLDLKLNVVLTMREEAGHFWGYRVFKTELMWTSATISGDDQHVNSWCISLGRGCEWRVRACVCVCVSACVCVVCSTYDCTGMSWVKIRHQTCMDRVLSNNANTANILLSTGRRLLKCTWNDLMKETLCFPGTQNPTGDTSREVRL